MVARFLAVQDPNGVGSLMRVNWIAVNHAGIYPTFGIGEAIAAHGLVVSKGDIDGGHFLIFEEVNIIGIWDRLTLHAQVVVITVAEDHRNLSNMKTF